MKKKRLCHSFFKRPWRKILVIMKLFFLLTCCFTLSLSANSLAQQERVSLKMKNVGVEELFDEVQRQTKLYFLFNIEQVKPLGKISLDVENETVESVLMSVFKDSDLTYVFNGNMIVVRPRDAQEDKEVKKIVITGKVSDTKKQPLPGVTVQMKGVAIGTATGHDGRYSLTIPNAPKKFTLVYSFVGMLTQEIVYAGKDTINVVMKEDVKTLEDVVVTGYMNINKGSYVGAVTSVKVDDIKEAGVTSIDQMLQGVGPGMTVRMNTGQVGANPKIRVRGTSTLLGNQEPIWVVDGVIQRDPIAMQEDLSGDIEDMRTIVANAISWLNPNDIETLTVLKDASATAIYGSNAANGVIVITTKRAQTGRTSVSYSGTLTVGQRPHYGLYEQMNSQERMRLSQEIYEERVSFPSSILSIGYEGLVAKLNSKEITESEMLEEFRRLERVNTDWFDILFRNSVSHTHSLSVTGGSDKISNRTSINISETIGEAIGNEMANFSVSSNTTVRFTPSFRTSFMLNGSYRTTDGFAYDVNPFNYAYNTSRVIPAYNEDGTYFYHEKRGAVSTVESLKSVYNYNIINERKNTGNKNNSKKLSATLDLNWELLPGLQYQGVFSYDLSSSNIKSWATENSFYITQTRGYEYGSVLANSAEEKASRLPWGGLLYTEETSVRTYTFRNSLVYDKTLNDVHRFTVQLGIEATSAKTTGANNKTFGYLKFRGEGFASVPLTYTPVGRTALNNDLYEDMRTNRKVVNRENNSLSEYFTGIYSYDNRYVLNFNARLDASNRFGQDPDKKFRPTWSAGLKWRVGNEHFTAGWDWIDGLDLSASYGYQGMAVETVSPYLIASDGGFHNQYKQYTLNIRSLPYDNLGWEKTKTWNFSVDLSFLKGRLNLVANMFKKDSDVLSSRDVPAENGMINSVIFGSKMENKGYDLTVNVVPVRNKDFTWQFSVNTAVTKNKQTNNERVNTLDDFLNGTCIVNGESYSSFYSLEFDGLDPEDGTPLFKNLDLDTDDFMNYLVYSGKDEPDFSGGLSTSFRYKNLRLQANFSMQFGGQGRIPDLYNTSNGQKGLPSPELNVSRKLLNRWKNPGDETIYPSLPGRGRTDALALPGSGSYKTPYQMYNLADIRVADTDFIRCTQLSLNYQFGEKVLRAVHANSLSLGISMSNPFMIVFDKKWEGIDPETGGWPTRRTMSLSLSVAF